MKTSKVILILLTMVLAVARVNTLDAKTPDYYDLKGYQTSVKYQSNRGLCAVYADVGAIEAAYVRQYGMNAYNIISTEGIQQYQKYGIAGKDVCNISGINACEEFDLSEEYYMHILSTVQHSNKSTLQYENIPSACSLLADDSKNPLTPTLAGQYVMATGSIAIPKDKYAPQFGGINTYPDGYDIYPNHTMTDFEKIAQDHGMLVPNPDMEDPLVDLALVCNINRTQRDIDNFEYDTAYIPLEARKNAVYGATKVRFLSTDESRNISLLETQIASDHEVSMGIDLATLYCSSQTHPDGNPLCWYTPKTCSLTSNKTCSSNSNCPSGEECIPNGNMKHINPDSTGGHRVLLIGYDRTNKYFLVKNSWGPRYPWFWVSYDYIKKVGCNGSVILDIRNPLLGPSQEAMWIGRWNMDIDGHLGDLVIRRTRETAPKKGSGTYSDTTSGSVARLGTYYAADGTPHKVTGTLNVSGDVSLFIEFDKLEGPPDPPGTKVSVSGQEVKLRMFTLPVNDYTHGNFAAGNTVWNGTIVGVLLSRPHINLRHTPGSFGGVNWKDRFKLYFSDGRTAILAIGGITEGNNSYLLSGKYYDLGLNREGYIASIDKFYQNRLTFLWSMPPPPPSLYYHKEERGIVSNLGVFGIVTRDLLTEGVIAAGGFYSLALKPDGTLWGWGRNLSGQLGDGTHSDKLLVTNILTYGPPWQAVSAGAAHSLAIKSDGTLWGWGNNSYGQVGNGSKQFSVPSPVQIGTDNMWMSISAGNRHSLGIKANGTLWAWGSNDFGQLGNGTTTNSSVPVQVGTDFGWIAVAAGDSHSLGLWRDGRLFAWGKNSDAGQLGDGSSVDQLTPVRVGSDNRWIDIAAGGWHSLGLKSDKSLWGWGYNAYGQVGDNTLVNKSTPVLISPEQVWEMISAGSRHSLGLTQDGYFWAWGLNDNGQLGDNSTDDKLVPSRNTQKTGANNDWMTISAGMFHSLGIAPHVTFEARKFEDTYFWEDLNKRKNIWSWGWNRFGQLGNGTGLDKLIPTQTLRGCYATLSNDFILHIPYLYNSVIDSYWWCDLQCELEFGGDRIWACRSTINSGEVQDPTGIYDDPCAAKIYASQGDLILEIPYLILPFPDEIYWFYKFRLISGNRHPLLWEVIQRELLSAH